MKLTRDLSEWNSVGFSTVSELSMLFLEATCDIATLGAEVNRSAAEIERLRSVMGKMAKALRKIAAGEGYYGAQAGEYKAIAKKALSRWEENKP